MDEQRFRELAISKKLKEKTIKFLLDEDYDSIEALHYMSVQQYDMLTKKYEITEGQKGLLRVWLLTLKGQYYINCLGRHELCRTSGGEQDDEIDSRSICSSHGHAGMSDGELYIGSHTTFIGQNPDDLTSTDTNISPSSQPDVLQNIDETVQSLTLCDTPLKEDTGSDSSLNEPNAVFISDKHDTDDDDDEPANVRKPVVADGAVCKVIQDTGDWRKHQPPGVHRGQTRPILRMKQSDRNSAFHRSLEEKDEYKRAFKSVVSESGVANVGSFIDEQVMLFSEGNVNLAVTGETGAGKSTLINTLRSLVPMSAGAAPVGNTETTMAPEPYRYPNASNIILWDLPGVNTPNFPMETYVDKVGLNRFDAVIICTSGRFSEMDMWLAQHAFKETMPFYMIRTKIDNAVAENQENFAMEEDDTLQQIRQNVTDYLQHANLPHDKLYLVCGKLSSGGQLKWDFPKLNEELMKNAPAKNTRSFIKALVSCSESIIAGKKKELEMDIKSIAQEASRRDADHEEIIRKQVRVYFEWFGLHQTIVETYEVKMKHLDQKFQDIHAVFLEMTTETKDRERDNVFAQFKKLLGKISRKKKGTTKTTHTGDEGEKMSTEAEMILHDTLNQCCNLALGILTARKKMARIS